MSTDLKIDLFAKDLFSALWMQHGLRKRLPKSKPPSEFNKDIMKGVVARQAVLRPTYAEIFEKSHSEFVGNTRYFFHTIVEKFPHYWRATPADDTVMSIFLFSLAFVAEICLWCKANKGDDFLDVADRAWAMFVDLHMKDTFYAAGGWDYLKTFAGSDLDMYDYVRTFSDLVHCNLGRNVLLHETHLTVAAVESFHWFETWEGVDEEAPMAMEWVDYCLREPDLQTRPDSYFKQAIPSVFEELENVVFDLAYICNPDYSDDDSDDDSNDDSDDCKCSRHDEVEHVSGHTSGCTSGHISGPSGPPTTVDQGKVQECVSDGSKAVKLTATDPEISEASEKPVHIVRLAAAVGETFHVDGGLDENSESRCSITDGKWIQEECLSKTVNEAVNIVVDKLLSSIRRQEDSKIEKMETDGASIPYNKGVLPVRSDSLDNRMESDRAVKETLSSLSSLGVEVTLDPADFRAANDSDESNMNTNPNDFDAIMEQLGLTKVSDYVSSDSNSSIKVYKQKLDSDKVANTGGILKETPKPSLLTPRKSPLTSPNINALSAPRKSPLTSPNINTLSTPRKSPLTSQNINVLSAPRKSPLTSPNINVLSTPRKSPLTSPNINALSAPRKSPLTSPNVNALSAPRKSPLTSPNVYAVSTPHKSPLTSPNVSVSSILDGTLNTLNKGVESLDSNRRRGKRCAGKENSPSCESKTEIKLKSPSHIPIKVSNSPNSSMEVKSRKSKEKQDSQPDNDSFSSKNFKDDPDSSKQAKGPSSPDKDDEVVNLAKYSVKTYARTKRFEIEDEARDIIDETSILDNQKESEHTIESSQTDKCANDIKVGEYPSRTSTCEGSDVPQNQLKDEVDEKSSPWPVIPKHTGCSDLLHSILRKDDENDFDFKKPVNIFEPKEMNDLSRLPIEKKCNRQISQDSSSTEIYSVTEDEISFEEPSAPNPFIFVSEAETTENNDAKIKLDCDKSFNTEHEMTSAEATNENPFGFEKAKKKKKSKKELNPNDSNREASQSEKATLESPSAVPSSSQDVEKKGKKKRSRKRPTRLEQRVKEEGEGIRDVMRLILVMGQQPAMAYFASTLQDAEKQKFEDENEE